MIASAEFSTVVEWLMYGGGITALVGLAVAFLGSHGGTGTGMAKPITVIGIVCFALGVLMGIYGGRF